jgi:hypothetical protein
VVLEDVEWLPKFQNGSQISKMAAKIPKWPPKFKIGRQNFFNFEFSENDL